MFPECRQAWWKFLMLVLSAGEKKKWARLVQKGPSLLITYIFTEHSLTLVCHQVCSIPSTFLHHGHLKYSCSSSLKMYGNKKTLKKINTDIMSLIFYSLKNRGKLACQKVIVTGTVTFTYHLSSHSSAKLKVINYHCPGLFDLWYSDVSQNTTIWRAARTVFPILL